MTKNIDLAELTDLLTEAIRRRRSDEVLVCGISGAQGAGKSTLCAALAERFKPQGLTCLVVALDDFYLSQAERLALAKNIHPLCATRGVPGTHDVARLKEVLTDLRDGKAVRLPQFDKSRDERVPQAQEPTVTAPPDIILLEGWCIGAVPCMVKDTPENAWEAAHDPHGIWKRWSRDAAQAYAPLWAACDMLVQLRQSDFEAVIDARWLQEHGNAAASGIWQFDSRAAVADFCAHYESWTKALWHALPASANIVIERGDDFTYRLSKSPD